MGQVLGWVIVVLMVILVSPPIIYCLWDDVMVKFFGLQDVTFMDSIWISILFSVLFKSTFSNNNKD